MASDAKQCWKINIDEYREVDSVMFAFFFYHYFIISGVRHNVVRFTFSNSILYLRKNVQFKKCIISIFYFLLYLYSPTRIISIACAHCAHNKFRTQYMEQYQHTCTILFYVVISQKWPGLFNLIIYWSFFDVWYFNVLPT